MSPVVSKILIGISSVVVVSALALIIYNQIQHKNQLDQIQSQVVQQQQLVDGIMRSSSQYATTADLKKFAADNNINLQAIQDNLNALNSKLAAINVSITNSTPQSGNNLPSSNQGPAAPPNTQPTSGAVVNNDPFGYLKNQQNFVLNEDFGNLQVPFGTVGFSAWQQKPWSVNVPQRQYNVDTVVGVDQNERQTIYNKFTVKVNNKSYDLPITTSTTKQQVPQASWSWWNPRLLMSLDGQINFNKGQGEFTPGVSLGIMSYGEYLTSPTFSILELGVGYGAVNKTGEFTLTPVAYNIGKKLFSPLMNNTYIGPSLSIATDGTVGAGLGLRVGF